MLTSIIGFPRVGNLRELKFATEKYFKHQISQERLQTVAKEIREKQWRLLKENGIDLIPSNDFSFYDTLLDSAALFNIIPSRYKELNLSDLDTYFAMSRGYQGDHGDVRALAMKKWFNTNYHYMVPEIEDDTEIKLTGTKLFDEFHEALHLGILTKPVITGPFTLLKLIRYTGEKQLPDFVEPMIHAYEDLISKAQGTEISWIQFDEPYLVHDLSSDDIALFKKIYTLLLAKKGNLKVLVQTYFGDVRDIYHELTSLDFDGIGLDFIEGKETKSLIKKEGFPKNKLLFVGIVNGKNIWKNHYGDSLATITWLKNSEISTVINTSCSLLHVPYTLKNETKLDADYTKHFAFAEEKLEELNELKILSDLDLTRHILPLLKTWNYSHQNVRILMILKFQNVYLRSQIKILPDFLTSLNVKRFKKMSLNYHCFQQLPLDLFLRLWMLKQIVVHLEKVRSAKVSMLTLTVKRLQSA